MASLFASDRAKHMLLGSVLVAAIAGVAISEVSSRETDHPQADGPKIVGWASLAFNGVRDFQNGTNASDHVGTGQYDISFFKRIDRCSFAVTFRNAYLGFASAIPQNRNVVRVITYNMDKQIADSAFSIQAFC